jgi:hypothetical protein
MPFYSTYALRGFKQFLQAQENEARHLFHENAHEWIALKRGGTLEKRSINFGGQSKVTIRGLKTKENHIQVAFAGMLGEAKGLKNDWNPGCKIDVGDRIEEFGKLLFKTIRHWPSDPDSNDGIDPDVPMECPMSSTEWGGLSVADLASSIALGLTEDLLLFGLTEVSRLFNNDKEWADFTAYNKAHPG